MKVAHNVKVNVFCHEGEDDCAILGKLLELFPFEIKKQLKKTRTTSHDDRHIDIFEVELIKDKEINAFFEFLVSKLSSEQKELLIKQINTRLDAELNFFLRLDKSKLLGGEYVITDSGNCFHVKILLAAYPKKREAGVELVKGIFE
ncbi:RNA-binding domain-containing protein [Nanoarchaeota archaeon]